MKKYFLSIATLFLLSLVIGGANVIADNSDDIDYDQIKEQMRQDGSSERDIENVIKKLKDGETLDSQKLENENKAFISNEQIEEQMKEFNATEEGIQDQIIRYDDGSYSKVELEVLDIEKDEIVTQDANGQFMTIRAKGDDILTQAEYTARLYIDTHTGGSNYIDSVSNYSIRVNIGNYEDPNLLISRKTEHRSEGISAKSYLTFKRVAPASAVTYYLRVHTGESIGDQYGIWVDFNGKGGSYE
ncbi:hypothetical protein [Oceanobacillus neutriphilus]|uniref:Uncharacterized protein n=1 Tax=Oceanobacillus neutriphilus TaxID=531815 RepID=A0ABQ2NNX8_9BACI|nr:hypothetical protein [Oceanobacillus neutriphilus]GGP08133.1 hypothetical protein GCM10011346_06960 [Oceanobacillus neutriphilus]